MNAFNHNISVSLIELTAKIVESYVSNNPVPVTLVGNIVGTVHAALHDLATGAARTSARDGGEKLTSAQIKKSITPDGLISFEDGMIYKTLKRHLRTHGLSPETYRAKYGLPSDYPMVSASYSAQRSELARFFGLGLVRRTALGTLPAALEDRADGNTAPATEKLRKAGRPRKASVA